MDVMTVTGPAPVETLGIILPHEHLQMAFDWPGLWPDVSHRPDLVWQKVSIENLGELRRNYCAIHDNAVLDSVEEISWEVNRFRSAGGQTMMEVSTYGLYGNPARLKEIARQTGATILAGTGFYLDQTFSPEIQAMSVEEMYAVMMRDLTEGFPGTDVKAGFIGEVAISPVMTTAEERSLRASARAQRDTGVCMNIHIGHSMYPRAIAILKEEGALLNRTAFAHCDGNSLETDLELVKEGLYVEIDCFGNEFYVDNGAYDGDWPWYFGNDGARLNNIVKLIEGGIAGHLLFSQDVCSKMQTVRYGGYGYAHLLENILPMLEHRGVPHPTLMKIMTENVCRYITGE